MGVIGGRVDSFSAKRKSDEAIKSLNINILIDEVQRDGRLLKINYTCRTGYSPDAAELEVKGTMMWEEENDAKAKAIQTEYDKAKRLPDQVAEEVITAVNYTNSAVGTLMAFGLGITAPINVARAKVNAKAGSQGKAN
jgi:hypothetical protein